MTTTWFKLPISYLDEPRMFHLRRLLGDDAQLLPLRLWCFAASSCWGGDMSQYTSSELADLLRCPRYADTVKSALMEAGYLDTNGRIADWQELFALAESRKLNAQKARAAQLRDRGESSKEDPREERGERNAARNANHPALACSSRTLTLSDADIDAIVGDLKITGDGVREALRVFNEVKAAFPGDPVNLPAFKGWIRTNRAGKAIRERHALKAPMPAPRPNCFPAEHEPEPEGWRNLLRGERQYAGCMDTPWNSIPGATRQQISNAVWARSLPNLRRAP